MKNGVNTRKAKKRAEKKATCIRFTKAMDECAKISYNKDRIFADRENPTQGKGFEEGKEERYHEEAV